MKNEEPPLQPAAGGTLVFLAVSHDTGMILYDLPFIFLAVAVRMLCCNNRTTNECENHQHWYVISTQQTRSRFSATTLLPLQQRSTAVLRVYVSALNNSATLGVWIAQGIRSSHAHIHAHIHVIVLCSGGQLVREHHECDVLAFFVSSQHACM